jgi:osomolarity two-component system response regulator SSK1
VTLEEPTPIYPAVQATELDRRVPEPSLSSAAPTEPSPSSPLPASSNGTSTLPSLAAVPVPVSVPVPAFAPPLVRRQSVVANTDVKIIRSLLVPDIPTGPPTTTDYFGGAPATFSAAMLHRKI